MENHGVNRAAGEARRAELLRARYGTPRGARAQLLAPILIIVAALVGMLLTFVAGIGAIGAVAILLWAVILLAAERFARRMRVFVPVVLLAVLLALSAPGWADVLTGVASVSALLGWAVVLAIHPFHGLVPGVTTLVVIYLWCVRTGRIR
ncbi:hypothetical protein [Brachybacterium tyrofermentans]|uniref:hypothetical protein n=1 Tax=Brachybacterium tyrofermentans TaxID=47848 RepID=UPI003FD601A1